MDNKNKLNKGGKCKAPVFGKHSPYIFIVLTVLALNLVAFIFLTSTDYGDEKKVNKISIANSDAQDNSYNNENSEDNGYLSINSELEIFQYLVRHTKLNHTTAFKWAGAIDQECRKYDIDPFLILAVIKVESEFKRKAVSNKGAVGLMQLMPSTARYIAKKYKIPFKYKGQQSLYDPLMNIKLGIAYLDYLENRYGNMEYALWSYNHGPKRYKEVKKKFKRSKPYYVKQVMNFKRFLESERAVIGES